MPTRAEVALQRVVHRLGFRPLPVRWVKNYQELTKVTEWPPYRAALNGIPRGGTRNVHDRVYSFLNPRDWAVLTTAMTWTPGQIGSALSPNLGSGLSSIWGPE